MGIERTGIYFAFLTIWLVAILSVACSLLPLEPTAVVSTSVNNPTIVLSSETLSPTTQPTLTTSSTKDKSLTPTHSPTLHTMATSTPTFFPTPTSNIPQPTPTYISVPIPEGLKVAYITQDTLYLWKESQTLQLLTLPNISHPLLSTDGQWIIFQQYQPKSSPPCCASEVWAIRSDGSDLHSLLSLNDLAALAVDEQLNFLDQIAWVPGRHELIFSTQHVIEGPPGALPTLDLYLLDLAGNITPLIEPGQGGWYFVPSPTGRYVVLVDSSRISRVDLQSGDYLSLLEYDVVGMGTDFPYMPSIVWDPNGRFVMTWIPPANLYQYDYNNEPVQLWRLFMAGAVEQIYRRVVYKPYSFSLSPDLRYLLYLDYGCVDGVGMLHVRNLTTGEEQPRYCVWELPRWAADSRHFIFHNDGGWQIGNVFDTLTQSADIFDPDRISWINDGYFLLYFRGHGICKLTIANLQGVITEIISTGTKDCPDSGFSLSK